MSASSDPSPFAEPKTNRLVWIVPSVLLHLVILAVWLSLPEEPPRRPGERKLTINRSQAEQLQQHVEDANLVMLHSKVSELQAIKQAMAGIRENQMERLRAFEEEMVVAAPKDAATLFTQFISSQQMLIDAYQELVETVTRLNTEMPRAEKRMSENQEADALAILLKIKPLWDQVDTLIGVLDEQTSISFALISTGEVKLEWIEDPAIAAELAGLKSSLEEALAAKDRAVRELHAAYRNAPGRGFDALMRNPEENIRILEAHLRNDGEAGNRQDERRVDQLKTNLNRVFAARPDPAVISEAMHIQVQVTLASKTLLERLAAAGDPLQEVSP